MYKNNQVSWKLAKKNSKDHELEDTREIYQKRHKHVMWFCQSTDVHKKTSNPLYKKEYKKIERNNLTQFIWNKKEVHISVNVTLVTHGSPPSQNSQSPTTLWMLLS